MATVRREFRSARSADEVWAVLRRFDAVPVAWPYDPAFATVAAGTAPDRAPDAPAPVAGWDAFRILVP